jgi:hypothetical protein
MSTNYCYCYTTVNILKTKTTKNKRLLSLNSFAKVRNFSWRPTKNKKNPDNLKSYSILKKLSRKNIIVLKNEDPIPVSIPNPSFATSFPFAAHRPSLFALRPSTPIKVCKRANFIKKHLSTKKAKREFLLGPESFA